MPGASALGPPENPAKNAFDETRQYPQITVHYLAVQADRISRIRNSGEFVIAFREGVILNDAIIRGDLLAQQTFQFVGRRGAMGARGDEERNSPGIDVF